MGSETVVFGFFLTFLTILIVFTGPTEAGECCRYRDGYGYRRVADQWCPDLCCYYPLTRTFGCCRDFAFRAASRDRAEFCADWFSYKSNLWAPILIAVIVLLVILCIVFACCHMCCFCF